MKKIVIYVVIFHPIKILVGWAHQNDCQNLSFVKALNVVGRKMTRNIRKMANSQLCHFRFRQVFSSAQLSSALLRCRRLSFFSHDDDTDSLLPRSLFTLCSEQIYLVIFMHFSSKIKSKISTVEKFHGCIDPAGRNFVKQKTVFESVMFFGLPGIQIMNDFDHNFNGVLNG